MENKTSAQSKADVTTTKSDWTLRGIMIVSGALYASCLTLGFFNVISSLSAWILLTVASGLFIFSIAKQYRLDFFKMLEDGSIAACPKCHAEISTSLSVCPKCGEKLMTPKESDGK